jgi:multidrug efflux pump subunit AcrA (membrane-fusion protein)
MWLPINHIQNDGEDYVYIVTSENRVERKNLKLKEINNDLVRVEGLEEGNRVITIGNSFVKEGQQVEAREASNE